MGENDEELISTFQLLVLQKLLKLTYVTNFISIYSAETVKRLNLLRYNAVDIGIQVGELHQPLQLQIIHCFVRVV